MSSTAKYAGFIAGGVVIGMLIAWGFTGMRGSENSKGEAVETMSATTTAEAASNSLKILSPQLAGNEVVVSSINVTAPTWVVVYDNVGGSRGNALGAALFFPGQSGGTVELLRPTLAGKSYLAYEQLDNGDRKFSLKDDTYVATNGAAQWVKFDVK
jgi:hypothetical protein